MKNNTQKIYKKSLNLHKLFRGKIEIVSKCPVKDLSDFSYWYTPGVAAPCKEIYKNIEKVFEYTNKWNTVAIISDGSRVLGLGDIGPYAALPVMEGKALIFKYLGGVDAIPIVLNTKNAEEIIKTIQIISSSFGGINLEDIEQPKCFYILEELQKKLQIPVWHDDQQGTATVTLAGLINSLKIVKKDIKEIKIVLLGAGAANMATARLLVKAGARIGNIIMLDSKGILHPEREDIKKQKDTYKEKWRMCIESNAERRKGDIDEAVKSVDVLIAASKPGPYVIKKQHIKKMAGDPIVFALANPLPEILPKDAKEAGARVVATGRSDFPNQINNSLCFPGMFRGVLDVGASKITDEMCISAAYAIASFAEKKGLSEDYIVPTMQEWEVYPEIACSVAFEAFRQGITRKKSFSKKQIYENAKKIILRARQQINVLLESKIIKMSLIAFFLISNLFSKNIPRYKYFAESLGLNGSCGKIHSINTFTLQKNKFLLGLHRFDIILNYGAFEYAEIGVKFNLEDQKDISNFEKNLEKISVYAKYNIINSHLEESPLDLSLGFYRTNGLVVFEKVFSEFSSSILVDLFFTFLEKEKFYYSVCLSRYTKWVEFIVDITPPKELYSLGARALLTPDIKLDLFFTNLNNISNFFFENFIFGVSIKI